MILNGSTENDEYPHQVVGILLSLWSVGVAVSHSTDGLSISHGPARLTALHWGWGVGVGVGGGGGQLERLL